MEDKKQAMLVGLCGRSGAGKGYVAKLFAGEGIPSIDTDMVYRSLTSACDNDEISECMKELVQYFGDSIKNADNSLNRTILRTLVFGEDKRDNLQRLNEITHRHILKKTMETADDLYNRGYSIVLIDAPVLFESGFDKFCAAVVCVTAPEELLIQRIMARDGLDKESVELRLKSQIPRDELETKAQYVIENNVDKPELIRRIKSVAESLEELRRNKKNEF